jgi:hypothetical protein
LFLVTFPIRSLAGELIFGGETGTIGYKGGRYKDAQMISAYVGYQFGLLTAQVNAYDFKEFRHQDYSGTYLDLDGYSVQAGLQFDFGLLGLTASAGLFSWEEEVVLFARNFGGDSGTSEFIDVKLWGDIPGPVKVFLSAKYLSDVSGGDIESLSLGVRVQF